MSLPHRCVCGHLYTNHTLAVGCAAFEWKPGRPSTSMWCDCTGYHRRVAAVRLAGRPPLDLCRKTDYTGELK